MNRIILGEVILRKLFKFFERDNFTFYFRSMRFVEEYYKENGDLKMFGFCFSFCKTIFEFYEFSRYNEEFIYETNNFCKKYVKIYNFLNNRFFENIYNSYCDYRSGCYL